MSHLFAYGTLMHPAVLQAVCGHRGQGETALLHGYRRQPLHGECYPAITAAGEAEVSGVLFRNIADGAWQRLDAYEGAMYRRVTLPVRLADGLVVAARCYLLRRRYHGRLAEGEWCYAHFLERHLRDCLRRLPR